MRIKSDDRTITVRIPISIRRRGAKKLVLAPGGSVQLSFRRRVDNVMVKALARAFRWQQLLENGTYATIAEIAESEKINETYVGRLLRLTLLSPQMVEEIVSGRHPVKLDLALLMRPIPVVWKEQTLRLGC
jgi:hypothetical protein